MVAGFWSWVELASGSAQCRRSNRQSDPWRRFGAVLATEWVDNLAKPERQHAHLVLNFVRGEWVNHHCEVAGSAALRQFGRWGNVATVLWRRGRLCRFQSGQSTVRL